jgi:hypothetical protein
VGIVQHSCPETSGSRCTYNVVLGGHIILPKTNIDIDRRDATCHHQLLTGSAACRWDDPSAEVVAIVVYLDDEDNLAVDLLGVRRQ